MDHYRIGPCETCDGDTRQRHLGHRNDDLGEVVEGWECDECGNVTETRLTNPGNHDQTGERQ